MLGLLGALDPYKHKLNQTRGILESGNAAMSKDASDSDAGIHRLILYSSFYLIELA